jgi:hypothetical protein
MVDFTVKSDLELTCNAIDSSRVAFIRVLEALIPNENDWLSRSTPEEFCKDFKKEIDAASEFLRVNRKKGLLDPKERRTAIRQARRDLAKKIKRRGDNFLNTKSTFIKLF